MVPQRRLTAAQVHDRRRSSIGFHICRADCECNTGMALGLLVQRDPYWYFTSSHDWMPGRDELQETGHRG